MKIFEYKEIWLRNASVMNDFMEIEHGFECLNAAYKNNKELVKKTLSNLFSDIPEKLENLFNLWLPHLRTETYIASVSEHGSQAVDSDEDMIGRLSMWRAYGGTTGVAVVMNNGPFLRPSDALGAFTSPVAYLSQKTFESEFLKMLSKIQSNSVELRKLGEEVIINCIFEAYRSAVLCTKHPGFHEEREWRVIFCPTYENSARLIPEFRTIDGTPQKIFKLPLKNVPAEGFFGAEIPELVERVIIGPTQFPYAIREAMIARLSECGLADARGKLVVSDIPLRN